MFLGNCCLFWLLSRRKQFQERYNYHSASLAITCPPVPEVLNAQVNGTLAIYGTYIGYECLFGFLFPNNLTELVIQCLDTGLWNIPDPPQCACKYCWKPIFLLFSTAIKHHGNQGSLGIIMINNLWVYCSVQEAITH